MNDRGDAAKQLLLKVLRSPIVGLPAGLGAATWLLGTVLGVGFLGFVGLIGVLIGCGAGLTQAVLAWGDYQRLAETAVEDDSTVDPMHVAYLDELGRRLGVDDDPRTDQHLATLRRLNKRLTNIESFSKSVPENLFPEIRENAETLYRSCLTSLERTLTFWDAANQMMTQRARRETLDAREQLIGEIRASIEHLGSTLDHLQATSLRRNRENNLARTREELDLGLRVAQRVEERMEYLERGLSDDAQASSRSQDRGQPDE